MNYLGGKNTPNKNNNSKSSMNAPLVKLNQMKYDTPYIPAYQGKQNAGPINIVNQKQQKDKGPVLSYAVKTR